jgi:hypothetical protein
MTGVRSTSYVLATVQANIADLAVRGVVPGTDKLTIYLTKSVASTVAVGFLVINSRGSRRSTGDGASLPSHERLWSGAARRARWDRTSLVSVSAQSAVATTGSASDRTGDDAA